MNAKFNIGGYELEITQNGFLTSADGKGGAVSKGSVGLQVTYFPLPLGDQSYPPQTVMQAFMKPSQARAVASALLSAATEARSL